MGSSGEWVLKRPRKLVGVEMLWPSLIRSRYGTGVQHSIELGNTNLLCVSSFGNDDPVENKNKAWARMHSR